MQCTVRKVKKYRGNVSTCLPMVPVFQLVLLWKSWPGAAGLLQCKRLQIMNAVSEKRLNQNCPINTALNAPAYRPDHATKSYFQYCFRYFSIFFSIIQSILRSAHCPTDLNWPQNHIFHNFQLGYTWPTIAKQWYQHFDTNSIRVT